MKIYDVQVRYKVVGEVPEFRAIQNASDIAMYMKGAYDSRPDQEQFWVILLNGANKPMGRMMVTMGLVNECQVHPREAFKFAVREGAVSVIFSHSHPSGSLRPSSEDLAITTKLVEAGKVLCIPVLDHVIIADDGYNSIRALNPSIF